MSEVIPFESYQDELTDIELETDSELTLSLCEHLRGLEIPQREASTLASFLQWARSTTRGDSERSAGASEEESSEVTSVEFVPLMDVDVEKLTNYFKESHEKALEATIKELNMRMSL